MDHRGKYLQLIICFFISKVNFRKVPVPHTLGSPVLKNPFLTVLQPDKAFCEHGDPVFFSLKDILSVCFWIYLNLPIFVHCLTSFFLIQVRTPGIKSSAAYYPRQYSHQYQPFTAPEATPATKRFWKITYTMITGRIEMVVAANNPP